jgi:hypothetical protein
MDVVTRLYQNETDKNESTKTCLRRRPCVNRSRLVLTNDQLAQRRD